MLVCAPSNVAVDQLAEKISATGLKVKNTTITLPKQVSFLSYRSLLQLTRPSGPFLIIVLPWNVALASTIVQNTCCVLSIALIYCTSIPYS